MWGWGGGRVLHHQKSERVFLGREGATVAVWKAMGFDLSDVECCLLDPRRTG